MPSPSSLIDVNAMELSTGHPHPQETNSTESQARVFGSEDKNNFPSKAVTTVAVPTTPKKMDAEKTDTNKGYSYVAGFHPTGNTDVNHTSLVNVVTPSAVGGSNSSQLQTTSLATAAAEVKRNLEMSSDVEVYSSKKKSKPTKVSLMSLPLTSVDEINSSYHTLKGPLASAPADPLDTFIEICKGFTVNELKARMRDLDGGEWPKNKNKDDAIEIVAKRYIEKLSTKRPLNTSIHESKVMVCSRLCVTDFVLTKMTCVSGTVIERMKDISTSSESGKSLMKNLTTKQR